MSQFIEMFGGGNWPQKTLGEVGSFTRGGGFQKSDFVEHGIPCIHYGQIHTKLGPFITSHITEISSDLESKTRFASKGDLVIAITSEDIEGSCKSTAWLGDYPVAVGGHAAIYKHSMNPLYMSFFFKSILFNHTKIEYVHGTKVFEIKPNDIAKILVPCPPMSLQNQFSAIAEQADKSGFDGLKSQFIEMFKDKGYPLTMIKSFADVSTGGTPSKAHPEYWNGDKPWVSAEDMKSKYVYDTCEKVTDVGYATCKIIPVDTLMFVCRGSIGVMAINKIECATNQSICRATCHDNVCNVEFLYHALMYQRDNIKKMGTGTSFKSLNQTAFSELEIELPPYDEQMKFVTIAKQADKSGSLNQYRIAS
ncbi:restriction endonuclease subunit S [Phocaeicola oris]|uniref:restriction endonuclease subunit S n=1 Tax=Phocaeicola oris TaxID=2896850 RepID=UPI00234E44F3|nr:restriction endonuclease subunit S [Phocaeicola oris]MCE2616573.1 restriction endonuclease subunit S [Phocaeicola oris]